MLIFQSKRWQVIKLYYLIILECLAKWILCSASRVVWGGKYECQVNIPWIFPWADEIAQLRQYSWLTVRLWSFGRLRASFFFCSNSASIIKLSTWLIQTSFFFPEPGDGLEWTLIVKDIFKPIPQFRLIFGDIGSVRKG